MANTARVRRRIVPVLSRHKHTSECTLRNAMCNLVIAFNKIMTLKEPVASSRIAYEEDTWAIGKKGSFCWHADAKKDESVILGCIGEDLLLGENTDDAEIISLNLTEELKDALCCLFENGKRVSFVTRNFRYQLYYSKRIPSTITGVATTNNKIMRSPDAYSRIIIHSIDKSDIPWELFYVPKKLEKKSDERKEEKNPSLSLPSYKVSQVEPSFEDDDVVILSHSESSPLSVTGNEHVEEKNNSIPSWERYRECFNIWSAGAQACFNSLPFEGQYALYEGMGVIQNNLNKHLQSMSTDMWKTVMNRVEEKEVDFVMKLSAFQEKTAKDAQEREAELSKKMKENKDTYETEIASVKRKNEEEVVRLKKVISEYEADSEDFSIIANRALKRQKISP
jgi:hypothetical protein